MSRPTQFIEKVILVIRFQFQWWSNSEITVSEKIKFTFSSCLLLPLGRGVLLYGKRFQSDNQLALLLLPDYVELVQSVRDAMDSKKLNQGTIKVLDVGANVGQFATAAMRFMNADVVSYEPNPACWPLLEANSKQYENWYFIEKAVSESELVMTLHYVPGKSAQGSFSPSNATTNLMSSKNKSHVDVKSGPVEISDLRTVGSDSTKFNLVKIDVEGFELEALKGLKHISFEFLLVEIAEDRDNGFTTKDVCSIAKQFLNIEIQEIYSDRQPNGSDPRNVLFLKL
jgi:FkbM family methyltransferase